MTRTVSTTIGTVALGVWTDTTIGGLAVSQCFVIGSDGTLVLCTNTATGEYVSHASVAYVND